MVSRLVMLVAAVTLMATACSPVAARPVEFEDMTTDEVGCAIKYGDDAPHLVGPLSTGDTEDFEPNDWTSFHLGRTALDIYFSIETDRSGRNGSHPLNNFPSDGVIAAEGLIDSGNPGYHVTCWRGDS